MANSDLVMDPDPDDVNDVEDGSRKKPVRVQLRWPKEVLLAARMLVVTLAVLWIWGLIGVIGWVIGHVNAFLASRQ